MDSVVATEFWQRLPDGRIQCDVCPRECKLKEGQRGMCFVRANQDDQIVLTSYGRSSGFCIDPIEKKPLNHFLPGTPILSFGTAGCNLACSYCQNWDISKSREFDRLQDQASPDAIADAAAKSGCRSVAFTYNDPVIFLEYAVDTAKACKERGLKSVAVSAGYVKPEARRAFFDHIDAANIDLKAFSEHFYKRLCAAELEPVLDTLKYLRRETDVWFELTTLVIPTWNDSIDEISRMTEWVCGELGEDVPMHFTAFHPDFRLQDLPRTPLETLTQAREVAMNAGLNYVYTGNVHNPTGDQTLCRGCGQVLIERDWYELGVWNLDADGNCTKCGKALAGCFETAPGSWGRKRVPVTIADSRTV